MSPIILQRYPRRGRARLERLEQCRRDPRRIGDAIARLGEVGEEGDDACRHVEADGIAGAAAGGRIVGHQDRDAPLRPLRLLEPHQGFDAVAHHGHAVMLRAARKRGEGKCVVARQRVLESDDAEEHAAVELGQHHIHGKIRRAKPARAVLPGRAPRRGDHHLQHRRARPIERRCRPLAASRECRRGDDDRRGKPLERASNERGALGILEARDHERGRRQSARGERRAERIDRRGVGGEQRRAVKDDRHHGATRRERVLEPIEGDHADARQVAAHMR